MKIGIIGNMNNGNFALMRYLRDLGCDAYLLKYKDEGIGDSKHFDVSADTWELEKWNKYIMETNFYNDPISLYKFPISFILFLRSIVRKLFDNKKIITYPLSDNEINNTISGFSFLVGNGISPAILNRVNCKLNVFIPYSIGLEWLGSPLLLKKKNSTNPIIRFFLNSIIKKQTKGVKQTDIVFDPGFGNIGDKVFERIKIKPYKIILPQIYNLGKVPKKINGKIYNKILKKINSSDFTILSHVRHLWVNKNKVSNDEWKNEDKNNDWIINEFSNFLKKSNKKNPLLILFNYGEDVKSSKKLIDELGISNNVIWLPLMERKYITWIISLVDVGVGEFYQVPNMYFGSTGSEILAAGKPLIHGFDFTDAEFKNQFNMNPPPVLAVQKSQDIYTHLINLSNNLIQMKKIGVDSKKWFDKNSGIGLSKKYLDIFKKINK